MTVEELIALLQNYPKNSIVLVNGNNINLVWDCPTSNKVEITIEEEEAPTEEEIEKMYEDYNANYGEILDAKYINGAV